MTVSKIDNLRLVRVEVSSAYWDVTPPLSPTIKVWVDLRHGQVTLAQTTASENSLRMGQAVRDAVQQLLTALTAEVRPLYFQDVPLETQVELDGLVLETEQV